MARNRSSNEAFDVSNTSDTRPLKSKNSERRTTCTYSLPLSVVDQFDEYCAMRGIKKSQGIAEAIKLLIKSH